MLRAFARVKPTVPGALLIIAPRQPERFGEVERLARDAGLRDRPAIGSADRRRAARRRRHARYASASWRSSIRSRPRCSSAAAWWITAATTSSSRRSSASRSCSVRTCRTSRRLPTRSCATARRCRCRSERELEEALLTLVTDPVRRARPRRGGARAGRGQPRRQGQDPRRHRRAAAAGRRRQRGPPLPPGPLIAHALERGCTACRRRLAAPAGTRAHAVAARRAPAAAGDQRRQPPRRRQRQDAGRRRTCARLLVDARRAAGDPDRAATRARSADDGVTVVSDGARDPGRRRPRRRRAADARARMLPGVPVLVGADRYLAGRLAEQRLGATVHLLDDGFQHVDAAARRRPAAGRTSAT